MLIMLLAGTMVAWLMVRSRGKDAERGAEIVNYIRHEGVARFVTPQTPVKWYLTRTGEAYIGWRARIIVLGQDGSVDGLDIAVSYPRRAPSQGHWERWSLNADATAGNYSAGATALAAIRPVGGGRIFTDTNTAIAYSKDRVEVLQKIERRHQSAARTPSNYLPEGMLAMAVKAVAERKTKGVFRLVLNSLPPVGDLTRLASLSLEGLPGQQEGIAARVVAGYPRTPLGEHIYHLDSAGEIVRIEQDGAETVAAGQDEVVAKFSDAMGYVSTLANLTKMPPVGSEEIDAGASDEENRAEPGKESTSQTKQVLI